MEKTFEEKLILKDEIQFHFTFMEYLVKTKLTDGFKIFLPKEIIDYIKSDEYLFKNSVNYDFLDEEIIKTVQESLLNPNKNTGNYELDFTENIYIQDFVILKSILALLGSVNSNNDFLKFTNDDFMSDIDSSHYLENFADKIYSKYVDKNIQVIFGLYKMKDLETLVRATKFLGLNIDTSTSLSLKVQNDITNLNSQETTEILNHNLMYTNIRNFVMIRNKLLLIITPSNNFWVKTEKLTLGTKNYDKRINNYSVLHYNWPFIKKFYDRIGNHPRVLVGYLNSMLSKNLKPSIDTIPIEVKNFNSQYLLFDQNAHDVDKKDKDNKPTFIRNFNKIINMCKSTGYDFNETNIIILESEKEKGGNTVSNMIELNVFSEDYPTYLEEQIENFELKINHVFNYLEKLLNECNCDVREYLVNNPLN